MRAPSPVLFPLKVLCETVTRALPYAVRPAFVFPSKWEPVTLAVAPVSTRNPLLDVVTFALVPLPLKVHPVIVAEEPGWSSSPDPNWTWSKWLETALSTPPCPTRTPSPDVPLVWMFDTFTVDPTTANPTPP